MGEVEEAQEQMMADMEAMKKQMATMMEAMVSMKPMRLQLPLPRMLLR